MSDECDCLAQTPILDGAECRHEEFLDAATGEVYHVVYAVHEASMSFETFRVQNYNEWFRELAGFLRFDGCINFETRGDTMAHYCDDNYKSLGFSLDCVYSIGRSSKVLR